MTTDPKAYDRRIRQIRVGQGVDGVGHLAWTVEHYRPCDCPYCDDGIHWVGFGKGWYNTLAEAEERLKLP